MRMPLFVYRRLFVMMRSCIRSVFARYTIRAARQGVSRIRLTIQPMEERLLPSTFTVVNTLDDCSIGSLRWAVGQANSTAGSDTINFVPTIFNSAKTITLGGTQLELTD